MKLEHAESVCVCVFLALSKFHFANKAPKWASEFAPLKSAHKSQQQDEQGPAPAPVPGLGLDHISECVCQLFMSVCVCVLLTSWSCFDVVCLRLYGLLIVTL